MSWKLLQKLGIVLIAVGILTNLKDIKRYYRISTM